MRVLQFGKYYSPVQGGIESFTYDLTEKLNSNGVRSDVLCFNTSMKNETHDFNTYKVIRSGQLFTINSAQISLSVISTIKKIQHQYDIIHVHLPNPMANLALYLSKPKAKIVIHWHSDIIKQKILLKAYHPLLIWLLKRADMIVATSDAYLEGSDYLQQFQHKVSVIPLGINTDNYLSPQQNKVEHIKSKYPNKRIIFALGRLVYYKGFQYLIEAAKHLSDDTIILIGGSGPLAEDLEAQIQLSHLNNKVFLVGRIPHADLPHYFAACDIFAFPSIEKSEAFGIVQLEAMLYGKPVVSTNIPGSAVPWVNKDGVTGKVVPVRDSQAFAIAINDIMSNLEKYSPQAITSYILDNFHIRKTGDRFISLYQDLLK